MGELKWEWLMVGNQAESVGYKIWNPTKGKVGNVGSHFAHLDEDAQPGWWRKDAGCGGNFEQEEEMYFPNFQRGAKVEGGAVDDENDEGGRGEAEIPALVEDSSDDEDGEDDNGMVKMMSGDLVTML